MQLYLENLIAWSASGAPHRAMAPMALVWRGFLWLIIIAARVYHARTAGNKAVAVKMSHTTKHNKNPVLRHEACVMITLREHPAIPEVYAWGRSQFFEYLALQELGEDLATLSRLTLRNLVALTCQLLDAVQFMHAHHIVHCDIKPSNVLFQRHPSGVIKLIDFGMAKLYRDPMTRQHRPQTSLKKLQGTRVFASVNVHHHIRPSRRDDIESLSYTVLCLLCGGLPWKNRDIEDADILRVKAGWSGATLGNGYPAAFGDFLEYARSLAFDEEPNYMEWRKRFKALASDIPEPPIFLVSDTGVCVGKANWPFGVHPVSALTSPESDEDADAVWGSDDMFSPMDGWDGPVDIPDEDLVGDEQTMVSTGLGHIDEVPGMKRPCIYTYAGYPERMVADSV
ncbi:kinase-like domain-containing protein [Schizophyllum commune]